MKRTNRSKTNILASYYVDSKLKFIYKMSGSLRITSGILLGFSSPSLLLILSFPSTFYNDYLKLGLILSILCFLVCVYDFYKIEHDSYESHILTDDLLKKNRELYFCQKQFIIARLIFGVGVLILVYSSLSILTMMIAKFRIPMILLIVVSFMGLLSIPCLLIANSIFSALQLINEKKRSDKNSSVINYNSYP